MAFDINGFVLVCFFGYYVYVYWGSGFCLFNNVVVVVQWLVEEGKWVVIFDFDGYFGDGIFEIFYNIDKVLYWLMY